MGGMWRKVKNVLLRMDVAPQCYSKWIGWVGMGCTSVGGMRYETLYSVEKMENMQIKSRSLFLFMLQMIMQKMTATPSLEEESDDDTPEEKDKGDEEDLRK